MSIQDNIKNITPSISQINTGTPAIKIGDNYLVGGIGGNFIPSGGGTDLSDGDITSDAVLAGYIGYGAAGRVVGSIPSQDSQSYSVGASGLTINAGVYLAGNQKVHLAAGYYNTSDATIAADKVLSGYKGYGASGAVTGNITVKDSDSYTVGSESVVIPSGVYLGGAQHVKLAAGYYNTADATITEDKVLAGYIGYGAQGKVVGTYTPSGGGMDDLEFFDWMTILSNN